MVGRKEIEQIERLYELYGFSKVKEADKFINTVGSGTNVVNLAST